MAIEEIIVKIRKDKGSEGFAEETLILDTGIPFALVPEATLQKLGIEPDGEERFFVGLDTEIRKTGKAYYEISGKRGFSRVLFGQEGDMKLLGFKTLADLGLMLHPFTREIESLHVEESKR